MPANALSVKAPWEQCSFTEDNAFHHVPAPATDAAKEWGEVSVAD